MRIAVILITVIVWLPPLLSILSMLIAGVLDCPLDEGSHHPCYIGAVDLGYLLHQWFFLMWYGIFLLPIILLTGIFWLIVGVLAVARRVSRMRRGG